MRFALLALALAAAPSFAEEAHDALDEVNRTRAARGLPPFQRNEELSYAAAAAAEFRARERMDGHTPNDFAYLPRGTHADAAGCAAWPDRFGWGACCTYDQYRTAGAAWCRGPDGRRYMHLFVQR